jgi:excisionase family DNA binding protein
MKRRQTRNDVARPLENGPFQTMPITVRIPQAVAMLGMSRSKLYQFIQSGEIEIVKIGRATLIPVESLTRFIATRRSSEHPSE